MGGTIDDARRSLWTKLLRLSRCASGGPAIERFKAGINALPAGAPCWTARLAIVILSRAENRVARTRDKVSLNKQGLGLSVKRSGVILAAGFAKRLYDVLAERPAARLRKYAGSRA